VVHVEHQDVVIRTETQDREAPKRPFFQIKGTVGFLIRGRGDMA